MALAQGLIQLSKSEGSKTLGLAVSFTLGFSISHFLMLLCTENSPDSPGIFELRFSPVVTYRLRAPWAVSRPEGVRALRQKWCDSVTWFSLFLLCPV